MLVPWDTPPPATPQLQGRGSEALTLTGKAVGNDSRSLGAAEALCELLAPFPAECGASQS